LTDDGIFVGEGGVATVFAFGLYRKMKSARVSCPVGLEITRDEGSYEIHAPLDVWDGHVEG